MTNFPLVYRYPRMLKQGVECGAEEVAVVVAAADETRVDRSP